MSGGTLCLVALSAAFAAAAGGQCWSRATRGGRCTENLRGNATREECCGDGGAATAWSPGDLRPGDLFYWRTLGGGVRCEPCRRGATCATVRCGAGRRCLSGGAAPRCATCPRRCGRETGPPVCASNGHTYASWCQLMRDACQHGVLLEVSPDGRTCRESQQTNLIPVFEELL